MDEVTAEELSEVLKPLGIVLKKPHGHYEMWTEDGLSCISPTSEKGAMRHSGWILLDVLARDLCNERNGIFAIVFSTGLEPHWCGQHDKLMDNPFCGCKSLDEMRIMSDLAGAGT